MATLTMVRPNEAVTAEWAEIDLSKKLWAIPSEKMKQTKASENKPHIVPLSKQALALLERIKRLEINSPYVFAQKAVV
nr:tyrosine-type recombinase/integrase [uncultured Haemophilus sp.]